MNMHKRETSPAAAPVASDWEMGLGKNKENQP